MIPYIIILFLSCWVIVLFTMVSSSLKSDDKNVSEKIRWNGHCLYGKINNSNVELEFFKTTAEHASKYGYICLNPLFIKKICISDSNEEVQRKLLVYLDEYAKLNQNDMIFGSINSSTSIHVDEKTLESEGYNLIKNEFIDFYKLV